MQLSERLVILAQRTEKVKQMKIVSERASRKEEAAPH